MIYLLKDKARLAQDREIQAECSDIINRERKREKYLRDALPVRLASLTADLAGRDGISPSTWRRRCSTGRALATDFENGLNG